MTDSYEDIIHLPRHVSKNRPSMTIIDRAAQFSPFAALTGHDATIKETARMTCNRAELTESMKDTLSKRLQIILERLKECPKITITYFQPDEKKAGGAYLTVTGVVKKIDELKRVVLMSHGQVIPMDEIIDIEGRIFFI